MPLSASGWQALVDHHHPSNTFALADGAIAHGRMQHAEIIYRRLPDDAREADTDHPDDLTKRARAKMALDPLLDQFAAAGRVDDAIALLDQHADLARNDVAYRFAELLDGTAAPKTYGDERTTETRTPPRCWTTCSPAPVT